MSDYCRICLEEDALDNLLIPCNCKGTQKFTHKSCLHRWQETTLNNYLCCPERYDLEQVLTCRLCKTKYRSTSANFSWRLLYTSSPLLALARKHTCVLTFGISSFMCFSFWLFFPILFNVAIFSYVVFWKKGYRFKLFGTNEGVRLRIYKIGLRVNELKSGTILKATNMIREGMFKNSKILIVKNKEEGAVGFIFNKFIGNLYLDEDENIRRGGPVNQSSVHVLHDNPDVEGCEKITDGVYVGGKLIPRPENTRCVIIKGYSAWDSLQLDGEIRSGLWQIDNAECACLW